MMYYNSNRNRLKNWLAGTDLKIYILMMAVILVMAVFVIIFLFNPSAGKNSDTKDDLISEENTMNSPQETISSVSNEGENSSDSVDDVENPDILYRIAVNKALNNVCVYSYNTDTKEYDTLYLAFKASVYEGLETGEYVLAERTSWRNLGNDTYVQYSSKPEETLLFHSAVYSYQHKGMLINSTYNAIGSANTDVPGVTLTVEDAKWIFENCPDGTVVEVMDDSSQEAVLQDAGYEYASFITAPDIINWDPTDPDKNNKWVDGNVEVINGVSDKTVPLNSSFDVWNGVYVKTTEGVNVTNSLIITGKVDTSVAGQYIVTYTILTKNGSIIQSSEKVTVSEAVN